MSWVCPSHSWLRVLLGSGEDLPFLERWIADLHRVCKGVEIPIGEETWCWDRLGLLHFIFGMALVLHYCDAMLPSASFCANISKHSKARVLHPMKTILKPRARRTRLVTCNGMRTSAVSLLCNCELDTLALWQRDPRLLRADDEDIVFTRSE
jgi:hypothetical protein